MVHVKQWQAKQAVKLACGHTLRAGEVGYTLTLVVCQQEVACLPQLIQACFAAQQAQAKQPWHPSLLYRLWHAWFGKTEGGDRHL